MNHTLKIKDITIGDSIPKICVPITGCTVEEILEEAKALPDSADIIEWRVDCFNEVTQREKVLIALQKLSDCLDSKPLLLTFRTDREGGSASITIDDYTSLYRDMIQTGLIDLLDVELFLGDDVVKELINQAHDHQVKVIVSNHDFQKTPVKEEIVARLKKMQELGADIPKIAVMPRCNADVLELLAATDDMVSNYANVPIVTMSMASTGLISRLTGEAFGSALTFGAGKKASAPGQIPADDLAVILNLIHQNMQ